MNRAMRSQRRAGAGGLAGDRPAARAVTASPSAPPTGTPVSRHRRSRPPRHRRGAGAAATAAPWRCAPGRAVSGSTGRGDQRRRRPRGARRQPAGPSIGPGEGAAQTSSSWTGYAEDGTNLPAYDWVKPFEAASGCKVNAKSDDTSDQMVTDMRQGRAASTTASRPRETRPIASSTPARWPPIDTATHPRLQRLSRRSSRTPRQYVVDGKHYGVPHGWGGNFLMYNTDNVTPAPTSWTWSSTRRRCRPTAARSPTTTARSTSRMRRCTSRPTTPTWASRTRTS